MPLHVITNFQIFLQEPDREERAKIVKSPKIFVGNGAFSSSGRFNRRFSHLLFVSVGSVSYMVLHCNGKLMHENELEK